MYWVLGDDDDDDNDDDDDDDDDDVADGGGDGDGDDDDDYAQPPGEQKRITGTTPKSHPQWETHSKHLITI